MQLCLSLIYSVGVLIGAANTSKLLEEFTFKPIAVDKDFVAAEVFPSTSLLECAASCKAMAQCSVLEFNLVNETCGVIQRDSVTWDNPTKTIFVETGSESKI